MKTPKELFPDEPPFVLTTSMVEHIEEEIVAAKRHDDSTVEIRWTYRSPEPTGFLDAAEKELNGAGWAVIRKLGRLIVTL